MKTRTPKSTKKTTPVKKGPARAAKASGAAATPPLADTKPESNEIEKPITSEEMKTDEKGKSPLPSTADFSIPVEAKAEENSDAAVVATEVKKEAVEGTEQAVESVEAREVMEVKEELHDETVTEEIESDEVNEKMDDDVLAGSDAKEPAGVDGELGGEGEIGEGHEGLEEAEEEPVGDGGDDDAPEDEGEGVEEEEQIEMSDMIKMRKIKKEREIFVGGLERDATEDDVKKVFEKLGEVVEVRLHRDFATNKNKGYAFVMFASKELANKALVEMKNPVIRGKRCGIAASEDNDTLFIGNICNTWTKEAVKKKLKDYGVEGLENITLVEDSQNEGLSRGFAFLEFSCHADAMAAYKRLQKPDVIFGHPERTAKVAFAEPLREPDAEVMAQVKSVFVDGMPPYWDEDRVREHFKSYGEIERIVLARNMTSAKRKDFGFVNFCTHEAAVACAGGVNNTELGDGKSKAKVRARLANPLPKTQAVKGGMRGGFRIGHPGLGSYSRFGRGFGRGRFQQNRGAFPGGRGFYPYGRGGRFPFNDNNQNFSHSNFGGRRPFGVRGGRRASFGRTYEGSTDELAQYPSRGGAFGRGRGRFFQTRRSNYPPEGEFGGNYDAWQFGEDPYFYGDAGQGVKRSFSMMGQNSGYTEPARRQYPRYDFEEASNARYRDPNQGVGDKYGAGAAYPDYYGSNFDAGGYSSFYGNDQSGSGHYYG